MTSVAAAGAKRTDVVVFILLVLVWGSSFLLMKVSLGGLAPSQIALARTLLAAVTLGSFMVATRRRLPREGRLWAHMAVIALMQCAIPFTLTAWVVQFIPSSLASIYNAVVPTLTVAFTPILLRGERLTRTQIVGITVGIAGVVVLIGPWHYLDVRVLGATLPAQLGMLASAGVYAFGLVYMRRFLAGSTQDTVTISTMQVMLAAVPLALLAPLNAMRAISFDGRVLASIVLLGSLGTGVAYIWQTRIVRAWGATRASTVTYAMPVVGVILGIAVLGETVQWNEPVGGAIILAGVLASQAARPGHDAPGASAG